jgi:hypothetical protein
MEGGEDDSKTEDFHAHAWRSMDQSRAYELLCTLSTHR